MTKELLDLQDSLNTIYDLDGVCRVLKEHLSKFQDKYPEKSIRFVIGVITSEGKEKERENRMKLARYTKGVREAMDGFTFCWEDIFIPQVRTQINAHAIVYEDFIKCSRNIVGCGYITDLYLTPGWEKSRGATEEYKVALDYNLKIHNLK